MFLLFSGLPPTISRSTSKFIYYWLMQVHLQIVLTTTVGNAYTFATMIAAINVGKTAATIFSIRLCVSSVNLISFVALYMVHYSHASLDSLKK